MLGSDKFVLVILNQFLPGQIFEQEFNIFINMKLMKCVSHRMEEM